MPIPAHKHSGLRSLATIVAIVLLLELALRPVMGNYAISKLRDLKPRDGRCLALSAGRRVVYTGWLLRIPPVVHAVNAAGYRGPVRPLARAPGALRILLVGDSFTFGQGVAENDTIAARLEAGLGATAGRTVQVLNFGVEALNIDEVLEQYERFASRWDHDAVLYLLSPNDLNHPVCPTTAWFSTLFRESYVARIGLIAASLVLLGPGPERDTPAGRARLLTTLDRYAVVAREHDARFGVVMVSSPLEPATWLDGFQLPLLDISALVRDKSNTIPYEGHLNPRGSGLVAQAIEGWLRRDPAWQTLFATRPDAARPPEAGAESGDRPDPEHGDVLPTCS